MTLSIRFVHLAVGCLFESLGLYRMGWQEIREVSGVIDLCCLCPLCVKNQNSVGEGSSQ